MNHKLGEKIKKKIRRRAFEQSDRLQRERQNLQGVKHTLDALHEVTGMPRHELKAIADEVNLSFEVSREEFLSIKNQILVTLGVSGFIIISGWLLFRIWR